MSEHVYKFEFGTTDGLLDAIERYGDYWFGRHDLYDVYAFLLGFRVARLHADPKLSNEDGILDAFQSWLIEEFCLKPREDWTYAIEQRAGSPDRAFLMLFDLYRQFKTVNAKPAAT